MNHSRLLTGIAALTSAFFLGAVAQSSLADPPSAAVLAQFENAPAHGPDEAAMPPRATPSPAANAATQISWPGTGLAQHPFLLYGEGNNVLYVVNGGKLVWTYAFPPGGEIDDATLMSNGHIILTKMTECFEVTPDKKIVWHWLPKFGQEIHCCQPVGLDKVMVIENGLPAAKMVLINKADNTVVWTHDLPVKSADDAKTVHPQYRNARITAEGTFLCPALGMSKVFEFDKDWKQIASFDAKGCWSAVKLKNGDYLLPGDGGSFCHEVNAKGEIVWAVEKNDLPNIKLSGVQTVQRLANGDTLICNHNTRKGEPPFSGVQAVEVTPEKKVVWVLQDWTDLPGCTGMQLLDEPGTPETPGDELR